jgi:hypothetical protein
MFDHFVYFLKRFTLCLGGGKGMEKKEYFKNILSFSLFGSLSRREWKGMESSFSCFRV